MLVINKNPREMAAGYGEAGRFEYQDTKKTVENGDVVFRLIVENDAGEVTPMFFSTKDSAVQFAKEN